MNQNEIQLLISKKKQKSLRLIRLYYGLVISWLILIGVLKNLATAGTLPFLLVLPLVLYFVIFSVRQTKRNRLFLLKYSQELERASCFNFSQDFSWGNFLLQPSFIFRFTLILYLITIISTGSQPHSPILSPIP